MTNLRTGAWLDRKSDHEELNSNKNEIMISMITVVEFRTKQAHCYIIGQLFFHWNWLEHAKGGKFCPNFLVCSPPWLYASSVRWQIFGFQSFFYVKNQPNLSHFLLLNIISLREELLLVTLFDYFHFWSTLFSEIAPNFCRARINPNQFRG